MRNCPHILGLAFDEDVSLVAENILKERGIQIQTGISVKEIVGKEKVEGVLLENGERIEADAVVLSLGYKPNIQLASDAGLPINQFRFYKSG